MSKHRRDKIQMTEAEIEAFLAERRTMVFTSNGHDGFPHPMPMWFTRDADGRFLFATYRKSQKVKNAARDPNVTLLAETGTQYAELRAVVVKARAEIVDDLELAVETLVDIGGAEAFSGEMEVDREALRQAVLPNAKKRVVVRCVPEHYITWDHSKLGGGY